MAAKPNPDPARITAAMWRLWTEFDAHHPEVQLGGIYARKPGYHSTRTDNRNNWPGDYSVSYAADLKGPADKSAAIDLTFPEAQRGDYGNMRKYTARLEAAARARDPRLHIGGTPVLREFIGTLDGRRTYAYDLQRRRGDHDRDPSHMWHLHLSVTRQFVTDWDVLAGVLSVLIGDSDMPLTDADVVKIWRSDIIPAPALGLAEDPANKEWTAANLLRSARDWAVRAEQRAAAAEGKTDALGVVVRELATGAGMSPEQYEGVLAAVTAAARAPGDELLRRMAAAGDALDGDDPAATA